MTEEEKEKVRTDFYRTSVKECHTFYDDKLAEWYLCKLVEQYEQINELKKENKKLRCCGNCKWHGFQKETITACQNCHDFNKWEDVNERS